MSDGVSPSPKSGGGEGQAGSPPPSKSTTDSQRFGGIACYLVMQVYPIRMVCNYRACRLESTGFMITISYTIVNAFYN